VKCDPIFSKISCLTKNTQWKPILQCSLIVLFSLANDYYFHWSLLIDHGDTVRTVHPGFCWSAGSLYFKFRPWLQVATWSANPFFFASSLPLDHFFFLAVDICTTPWTARLLFDVLRRRTLGNPLLLTIMSVIIFPWLTFAFCTTALLFLRWSNGMATDIDSLAPGLALLITTIPLPTPLWPLPLTVFEPPVSSPLLHYLGHDTRLGNPILVHTYLSSLPPSPHIA
jgi:hypothetical protein